MMFHGQIQPRILRAEGRREFRQNRFYCPVHGWYDLFVFPDACEKHAGCSDLNQPSTVGLEVPKTFRRAA